MTQVPFQVSGDQIQILKTPVEFRATLFDKIRCARIRVLLCTLYIGGEQRELLQELYKAQSERDVQVHLLTDFLRTRRPEKGGKSSLDVMHELFQASKSLKSPKISAFQVPQKFITQNWFPYRLQETLGVMHWKFYVFDDDVIISGANLSETYLSNRQDRWILIKDAPEFAKFLCEMSEVLRQHSKIIDLTPTMAPMICEPFKNPATLGSALEQFLSHQKSNEKRPQENDVTIEFGVQYGSDSSVLRNTEKAMMDRILDTGDSEVILASPYLNLPDNLVDVFKRRVASRKMRIIAPTPDASSFFRGGPFLNAVPFAYATLTRKLVEVLNADLVPFYGGEDKRTFHVKGVWTGNSTLIGSSNFGARSATRDLECLCLIRTNHSKVLKQLNEEVTNLVRPSTSTIRFFPQANWWTSLLSNLLVHTPFLRSLL